MQLRPVAVSVFFAAAFLALLGGARAQTTTAPDPAKKPVIITWRAVAFENAQEDLFVKNQGRELPLSIPAFGISAEYRYSGPNPITIYRRPPPSAPENTEPVAVASVFIETDCKRALIFLFPKRDGTLIAHSARSDETHFSPGTMRIYNLVNQPLVLRIDGRDQTIDPGQSLHISPATPDGQIGIRYGLNTPKGVRWVGSNYFSVTESGRTTVIITRTDSDYFRPIDADGQVYAAKSVQAFSFSESVPPPQ